MDRIVVMTGLVLLPALVLAHGMSEAERQAIVSAGNWGYLSLGATHMLSGYDHLLVCLWHHPKFLSWAGRSVRAGVCRARHDDAQ